MHGFTTEAVSRSVAWKSIRRSVRTPAYAPRAAPAPLARGAYSVLFGTLLVLLAIGIPSRAQAQLFITDDAAIVDHRACLVETWHGETESWIEPACQFVRNLELAAGIGFIAQEEGGRATKYLLEGKTLFRELQPNSYGVGLVVGTIFDPRERTRDWVEDVYAYIPLSLSLADDRLILHLNSGWHFERDEHTHNGEVHAEAHHALTWGLRGDLMLTDRFGVIGELFGEDRYHPEYQVALRTILLSERLSLDLSYGGHTASALEGKGWVVGLSWTPPPFF